MTIKIILIGYMLAISTIANCQTEQNINKTDPNGRKQGHWIKKYPDNNVLYEGYFKDDHPVGEFKRYYENKVLKSLLIFTIDGVNATATIYHPNGNISSKGKYVNQKKEGKWQYFSEYLKGCLIAEEQYTGNIKNGLSVKFYSDSTIAERVSYVNGIKHGEYIRYYPGGAICMKSNYLDNKIDGKFEVWFENGKKQFSGQYKEDTRDGIWYIYSEDGTLKYKLEYVAGVSQNRQLEIDESDFLESVEKNAVKLSDPEKPE